jgi:hypothetical protein
VLWALQQEPQEFEAGARRIVGLSPFGQSPDELEDDLANAGASLPWAEEFAKDEDNEDSAILQDWLQRRAAGARDTIPLDELEQELAADGLDELRRSDADIWSVARSTLSAEQRQQLEALHDKQQRVGLTPDDLTQEEALRTLYRDTLLVRTQAVALLQQRGYDVSDPAAFHPLD